MGEIVAAIIIAIINSVAGPGAMERAVERGVRARLGKVKRVAANVERGHRSPLSRTIMLVEIDVEGFNAEKLAAQPLKVGGAPKPYGKIARVVIRAKDFRAGGIEFEQMKLTMHAIRYSLPKALLRREFRLARMGEGAVSVSLTEKSLDRFVKGKITDLQNPSLKLQGGRVVVQGRATRLSVPIEFDAFLEAKDGRIELTEPRLRVSILPMPGFSARRIASQANPVLDLNQQAEAPFRFRITGVAVASGRLAVQAVMTPQ